VNGVLLRSLGDLLTLQRRPVNVVPETLYAEIGIYSFGRGIFHKSPRSGLEVGDKPLFLIKEDDFILHVTFAWEGAVGLATSPEDGMYGSVRFPTFRVNEALCYPPYLFHYFRSRAGREQLVRISPGSAGRNRVLSLKRIPEVLVPLPNLGEQRRIVAWIEKLSAKVEEAARLRRRAVQEAETLLPSTLRTVFGPTASHSIELRTLMELAYGNGLRDSERLPGSIPVYGSNGIVGFHSEANSAGETIVVGRKGSWGAVNLSSGSCWVIDTAFKVVPKGDDDVRYLFYLLRSIDKSEIVVRNTAKPGINRNEYLRIERNYAASSCAQRRIVAYLDSIQAKVNALKRLQAETAAELDAMLPSILDKAFKGEP